MASYALEAPVSGAPKSRVDKSLEGSAAQLARIHLALLGEAMATMTAARYPVVVGRADAWFGRFSQALEKLQRDAQMAPPGSAPTRKAFESANGFLADLWDRALAPARVSPSADEGLTFFFFGTGGHASVESLADGGFVVVIAANGHSPLIRELDAADPSEMSGLLRHISRAVFNRPSPL